jgi:hypothetical protein
VVSFTLKLFNPWAEVSSVYWTGGCMDLRVILEAVEKRKTYCPIREANSDSPVIHILFTVTAEIFQLFLLKIVFLYVLFERNI